MPIALLSLLSRAAAYAAAAALMAIGLIVAYEVVMRYVFVAPTRWVEEIAQLLQIYAVFFAGAWLIRRRDHVRITVLTDRLPAAGRLWATRANLLVAGAVTGFASWQGGLLMLSAIARGERTDSTLELPMWLLHGPVTAGLGLAALEALAMLWQSFRDPAALAEGETGSGGE